MKILGLAGYAGSGKDTVAEYLVSKYGYERRAFADALKNLALELDPILPDLSRYSTELGKYGDLDTAKRENPYVREFLQHLGVAVRDTLGVNAWVNIATRDLQHDGRYVLTDVRFPNEVGAVRVRGGSILRVDRPGTGPANGHVSEQPVAYDYVLDNSGDREALHAEVDLFMRTHPYLTEVGA